MSKNGVANTLPFWITFIVPGCSTTYRRPASPLGAAVRWVGSSKPRAMTTGLGEAPCAAGTATTTATTRAAKLRLEKNTPQLVFFPRLQNRKHLVAGAERRLSVRDLELSV